MSDKMNPIPLKEMLSWILAEYRNSQSIFGIPESKFYRRTGPGIEFIGERLGTPIGPAAGPHTQMAQNIVAAYLTGGRFFELKTVQILDGLKFPKPCIAAQDEGYNTEWSTEFSVEGALAEYVKAWLVLHILSKEVFGLDERDFVFNMSIGYNLEGIQSPKIDAFINGLKDAAGTAFFHSAKEVLKCFADQFTQVDRRYIDDISPNICRSVTLSTMHGCPPSEIDSICRYLIEKKNLHTFVKMNPTLLGHSFVRSTFDQMGYNYVVLKPESFSHDLQYNDGVAMLRRLKSVAASCRKEFGVKLANTLPVQITRAELPGEEMYMSGRSIYPLTINLAYKLACEFDGDINISYAGGADYFNVQKIYEAGLRPITMATTLLKPGGYYRLHQMAVSLEPVIDPAGNWHINRDKLKQLASQSLEDTNYIKHKRPVASRKIAKDLPLVDCFVAPCTVGCPIGQDVPDYIRLVGEKKYEQAYRVILDKNPLPFITGTICRHYCMDKCTRLDYDDSVLIREVKLLAANRAWQPYLDKFQSPPGRGDAPTVVVGAGPSGLSAACFLARAGLAVTVLDRAPRPGGMVTKVIPEFRISPEVIERDISLIRRMGVKFELGIPGNPTIEQLMARGFKYIYFAVGAGKSKHLAVTGDTGRMASAISFLEQYKNDKTKLSLGSNVVVVGGGNTAIDAARTALRVQGVQSVTIVYRRMRQVMPAIREEVEMALQEGAILKESLSPIDFHQGLLRCLKMASGNYDRTARCAPAAGSGEYEVIPADYVLTAIGEMVDSEYLIEAGLPFDSTGKVSVDPLTLETAVSNVFIGGDALSGPGTVVDAIADGMKVAGAIIAREHLAANSANNAASYSDDKSHVSIINGKKGSLVSKGCVECEPSRCLECNYVCKLCVEVCPNRANVPVLVPGDGLPDTEQILHIDALCNECGNCDTFCPYSGAPYRDKFTYYWSEDDFISGSNDGFVLLRGGADPLVRVRVQGMDVKTTISGSSESMGLPGPIGRLIWAAVKRYSYLLPS